MKRTGTATMPLHSGRAPRWLFERMKALAGSIVEAICIDFGTEEFLRRLSDPLWFQALGCVLGFDWHSSGLTTTVTGAIKESLKDKEGELGLFVAGGKGRRAIKTPEEIEEFSESLDIDPQRLIYSSRITAKVDNSALQDGYRLYHHAFFFDKKMNWAVIQQGMSDRDSTARRYHWLSENVSSFVEEPHSGVYCPLKTKTLNLVHKKGKTHRETITELAKRTPEKNEKELKGLLESLKLPHRHKILLTEDINPKRLHRTFCRTYERAPENFEALLSTEGVGPKTLRALSLVAELIYGSKACYEDPARFSYAHGGKDGVPYPVDIETYEKVIGVMKRAVEKAKVGQRDKLLTLKKIHRYYEVPLERC